MDIGERFLELSESREVWKEQDLFLDCLHFEPNAFRPRPSVGLGSRGAPTVEPFRLSLPSPTSSRASGGKPSPKAGTQSFSQTRTPQGSWSGRSACRSTLSFDPDVTLKRPSGRSPLHQARKTLAAGLEETAGSAFWTAAETARIEEASLGGDSSSGLDDKEKSGEEDGGAQLTQRGSWRPTRRHTFSIAEPGSYEPPPGAFGREPTVRSNEGFIRTVTMSSSSSPKAAATETPSNQQKQRSASVDMIDWPSRVSATAAMAVTWAPAPTKLRGASRRTLLQNIRLSSPRVIRMSELDRLRRRSANARAEERSGSKELYSQADIAFQRYFGEDADEDIDGGPESNIEIRLLEALADVGIKANTRADKVAIQEVIAPYCAGLDSNDFRELIDEARAKLKAASSSTVFLAWRKLTVEEIGHVDAPGMRRLLAYLGMDPVAEVMNEYEMLIRHSCRVTRSRISFTRAEDVVAQVRELLERNRRKEQRRLKALHEIPKELFNEFRGQLLELWKSFCAHEQDGTLKTVGVLDLLTEFGFISPHLTASRSSVVDSLERAESDGKNFNFRWLLSYIHMLRKCQMETRDAEVNRLFQRYDHDHSGELDMREVNNILMDVNLQPRTPQEQQGIAQLIEEVDEDGSGQLSINELEFMVQRIEEKFHAIERSNEYRIAAGLHFTKAQVDELRRAFYDLDHTGSGHLGSNEIVYFISIMTKIRMSDMKARDLLRRFDVDRNGMLDFGEFITLLSGVDQDMKLGISPPIEQPTPVEPPAPPQKKLSMGRADLSKLEQKAPAAPPTEPQVAAPPPEVSERRKGRMMTRKSTVMTARKSGVH
mmetsp:Transcript_21844/g.49763  ORF Transcript_21844/g.49763 Transcript_21844/m.49763 type:complete len:826 (-) Transcript_21844:68-2545(-)